MAQTDKKRDSAFYDPETVLVLKDALEEAWASLLPAQQARTTKSDMAARILAAAASGERDPSRLKTTALIYPIS